MTEKAKKKTAGRLAKLTPERSERIILAVRAGSYLQVAASYAGIGYRTLMRWLQFGREEGMHIEQGGRPRKSKEIYWQFWQDLQHALSQAEMANLAIINKAAQGWEEEVIIEAWELKRDKEGKLVEDGNGNYIKVITKREVKKTKKFDVKAAQWLLGNRAPNRWKRNIQTIQGGDEPIKLQTVQDEDIKTLQERIDKHQAQFELKQIEEAEWKQIPNSTK